MSGVEIFAPMAQEGAVARNGRRDLEKILAEATDALRKLTDESFEHYQCYQSISISMLSCKFARGIVAFQPVNLT